MVKVCEFLVGKCEWCHYNNEDHCCDHPKSDGRKFNKTHALLEDWCPLRDATEEDINNLGWG